MALELRSRSIGTALVAAAENLVRERGYPWLGLGVADDNQHAAALYNRLGYQGGVRYLDRWSHLDETGARRVFADWCMFLVKELRP